MEAVCTKPCCQLQWVLTSKESYRNKLFLQFLKYPSRLMMVEGHVNSLYDNIHNCMFNVELHRVNSHNFVQPITTCLLCIWCSLHASSSHRANLFSQHMAQCCKSFHSLILHVLRCTVNDHHHYHSSIVCGSTSRDSTPTTVRGCVLPCNHIEYYVIATLHPWAHSVPYYHIVPYCGL